MQVFQEGGRRDYPETGAEKQFVLACVHAQSGSHAQCFVTPQTIARQAPPSMGFSRQEYWIGVPLPIEY